MAGWQGATSFVTLSAVASRCTIDRSDALRPVGAYPRELSTLVRRSDALSPLDSLVSGRWVKLICGASFEDVADVRNLSIVYTLAGVDCIDCAADPPVVSAVNEGIELATQIALTVGQDDALSLRRPWVMVSINDDEDLHFRKAEFDPSKCPSSCPRPCERICPASAIQFYTIPDKSGMSPKDLLHGGVLTDRCYGCGRCISACPLGLIDAKSYVRNLEAVSELFNSGDVDAVEIHTNARHLEAFKRLWECLRYSMQSLKLIAVSLPDLGDSMISTMWDLYGVMRPELNSLNIWQMDGRPMSGDIGAGATKAAVALAAKIAAYPDRPPGFLQLAGGTNAHTMKAMKTCGLNQHKSGLKSLSTKGTELNVYEKIKNERIECAPIGGIAYGGYARKIVCQVLENMDPKGSLRLEHHPLLLLEALKRAASLVCLSKDS